LDSLLQELNRREEVQGSHRNMVSALIVTSELGLEIIERETVIKSV